jgi:V/A-type H+-transporting ATPase subunit A
LDAVYMQQNAFDAVDAYNTMERQIYVFNKIDQVLHKEIQAKDKDDARNIFFRLTALIKNWNSSTWESDDFKNYEKEIHAFLEGS